MLRVKILGLRVWDLEFRVQGLGFRVQGLLCYSAEAEMVMPRSRFERVVPCDMLLWPEHGWPSSICSPHAVPGG